MDQMDGQLTPACIQTALERRRVPNIIWGCLTGMVQPADKRQNQIWKAEGSEVESTLMREKLEKHPGSVCRLNREELLYRAAEVGRRLSEKKLHLKMALEFPRSGINLDLEGKQDGLLDKMLVPYWNDPQICGAKSMPEWRQQYFQSTLDTKKAKELEKAKAFVDAKVLLSKRSLVVPESLDELMASLENPHIPEGELLAREEDDFIHFEEDSKAMEVTSLKLGALPDWLAQRYKSKFPGKNKKETPEAKEERLKKSAEDFAAKKSKTQADAASKVQEVLGKRPAPEAPRQEHRDWDREVLKHLHPMLSSPRAKRKVGLYVAARERNSINTEAKRAMLKELWPN